VKPLKQKRINMKRCLLPIFLTAILGNIFSIKGQTTSHDIQLPVEIAGVTVVPHYVSGEIPNYSDEEKYLSKYKPGALIRIFVRNSDTASTILPEVRFNGKTGQELINSNVVSYCDVPDTREKATKMSIEIPAGAMDCYLLNVTDSNFFSQGITLKFKDKNTGSTSEKTVSIKTPDFYVPRISFTSTNGSYFPDGFYVYFSNNSEKDAQIRQIKIWNSGNTCYEHWWQNKFMDIDLNVLAGPYFAALFAIDLNYKVSESNQFVSAGKRKETMTFRIPSFLDKCNALAKVGYAGISKIGVALNHGYATLSDTLETTGLYILYNTAESDILDLLTKEYFAVKAVEASFRFDPIKNDSDFRILTEEVQNMK
jgi:hypothetical protein